MMYRAPYILIVAAAAVTILACPRNARAAQIETSVDGNEYTLDLPLGVATPLPTPYGTVDITSLLTGQDSPRPGDISINDTDYIVWPQGTKPGSSTSPITLYPPSGSTGADGIPDASNAAAANYGSYVLVTFIYNPADPKSSVTIDWSYAPSPRPGTGFPTLIALGGAALWFRRDWLRQALWG